MDREGESWKSESGIHITLNVHHHYGKHASAMTFRETKRHVLSHHVREHSVKAQNLNLHGMTNRVPSHHDRRHAYTHDHNLHDVWIM